MNNLRKFDTKTDYNTALGNGEIVAPNVSYVVDEGKCYYTKKPHTDFGQICMYDKEEDRKFFISPESYATDYWMILRYVPIGVVVVPTKYTPDGSTRIMSLVNMSCKTPETGSYAATATQGDNAMYWGGNGVDIPGLKNITQVNRVDPTTGKFASVSSWMRIPSECSGMTGLTDPVSGYKYWSTDTNEGAFGPYPILANGEKAPLYYASEMATNDFNGKENTDAIIAAATDTFWKTASTITNSYDAGNYPPAFCCRRFKTAGTNAGDWYLPAEGELAFYSARYDTITNTLNTISTLRSTIAVKMVRGNASYGDWLWSSSEYSSTSAWDVNLSLGYVGTATKSFILDYNRVRSFLSI